MMEPFHERFLETAEKETRCMIIPSGKKLPEGEYFLTESYCNDSSCDCRRVFINIIHNQEIVATIGYGWEDLPFYERWLADKELTKEAVALYRYVDGKWTELSTAVGEDDGLYVHYTGTTPGFSYFVIGERAAASVVAAPAAEAPAAPEEAAEAAAEVPAEEAPEAAAKLPVWLIPVIAALVIAALLYWYWKRK